jgi:hypothetical protein
MEAQGSFETTAFLDFANFRILQTIKFRKVDLFPFSGEEVGVTYSVGPLRKT